MIGDHLVQTSTLFTSIVKCEYVLNIMKMLLTWHKIWLKWVQTELVKECFKHNFPNLLYKITSDYNLCTCLESTKRGIEPLALKDNCTNNLGVLQPNRLRHIPFEKLECSNFDINYLHKSCHVLFK